MQFGHAGEKTLRFSVKQDILKGAKSENLDFCEHCMLGRQKRVSFGTTIHKTKCILDYVHNDI